MNQSVKQNGITTVVIALALMALPSVAFAAADTGAVHDVPHVVPVSPDGMAPSDMPDVTTPHDTNPQGTATPHDTTAGDHTADAAHTGGGGLPQFDATWFPSQIFWLAITFLIMYRFFSRVALPRIAGTIAARADKVSGDIRKAEELTETAKSIRTTYEREIARAKDKASDAVRDVDAKIKEKAADMMYSYRTKMTMETTRAMDELNREKSRLIDDMHKLAATIAADATSKILETPVDADQAARIIAQIDPHRQAA